ncbi:hypothetical protein DY245_35660 [Streptomyces inhibens]|uniref:Uncharacterized protein n=1 Tax=Streptomyces inhibens TaxID=2293571 RepID=A0A371PTV3_STRIH|nr:hypothetical protein [Streptomyces inhibens]REK85877.1 hypothetical protein DY245_35660 [Streptomyces inhibens]
MRRIKKLLTPLTAATTRARAAPDATPSASGFLTIGTTTYIDPRGSYPLDHRLNGYATLIINDTNHHITIVTERNHNDPPTPPPDQILAPGQRTETHRGDSVQVG